MPEALTRAALIDAAARAIIADYGVMEDEAADEAESAVAAVLPLIADAIDATPTPATPDGLHGGSYGAGFILAKLGAVAYIRSLRGADDD